MATEKELRDFEDSQKIRYLTEEERDKMKLGSSSMLVGEGTCPGCGQKHAVLNDAGAHGMGGLGWRGSCYFENHYLNGDDGSLCHNSENMFGLLANQEYQAERAKAEALR